MATDPKDIRIVFFGTPLFAVPALQKLVADGFNVVAAITAPDKPVGRRMLLTPSPIKVAAQELNIPVHAPMTLKDDAIFTLFTELKPELCVVVAYGKLIGDRYLQVPRLGFINIHPSLLPAYRGPSPIPTAILDGLERTGISLMLLDAEMDHGPVITREIWDIPPAADTPQCEETLARLGADLLVRALPGYIQGTMVPEPQDHSKATLTHKFERTDGKLKWSQPAASLVNRIRALGTNPGTWTTWGGKTLNITHAHIITDAVPTHSSGTVFSHAGQLAVACGQGALAIQTLQLEGSTRQSARDFLNGRAAIVGTVLGT